MHQRPYSEAGRMAYHLLQQKVKGKGVKGEHGGKGDHKGNGQYYQNSATNVNMMIEYSDGDCGHGREGCDQHDDRQIGELRMSTSRIDGRVGVVGKGKLWKGCQVQFRCAQ